MKGDFSTTGRAYRIRRATRLWKCLNEVLRKRLRFFVVCVCPRQVIFRRRSALKFVRKGCVFCYPGCCYKVARFCWGTAVEGVGTAAATALLQKSMQQLLLIVALSRGSSRVKTEGIAISQHRRVEAACYRRLPVLTVSYPTKPPYHTVKNPISCLSRFLHYQNILTGGVCVCAAVECTRH